MKKSLFVFCFCVCFACFVTMRSFAGNLVTELTGKNFDGGGKTLYGSVSGGRNDVNVIYAKPTGQYSEMKATFSLEDIPELPLFFIIEACDDDFGSHCKIDISLNGTSLFSGPNEFPKGWKTMTYPIPDNLMKTGTNSIVISNLELEGTLGMPPWFRLARLAISADSGFRFPKNEIPRYVVDLTKAMCDFPEPLSTGEKPGFPLRGIKGWMWEKQQYLDEIPVMLQGNMNFLMSCYGTLFTPDGQSLLGTNEWWKPLRPSLKNDLVEIIKKCHECDITFCYSSHSQLCSPRPLDPTNRKDIDDYWQNIEWIQQQGVQWFSISLDDVSWGTKGPAQGGREHANLVNIIFERLRKNDPEAQMIFCPVPYWGDGTAPEHRLYLESLGQDIHEDAYIFWTGDAVVTEKITYEAAISYKSIVKHRLFIWDNYPVNDAAPTLHLAAVTGRDPRLGEVCDGYMSNPLCPQNQINRIPMLTCADYAWNPKEYDPQRSIAQTIALLGKNSDQRNVLKDLVELYPGMLFDKTPNPGYNSALARFDMELSESHDSAEKFIEYVKSLVERIQKVFPGQYKHTINTIHGNIQIMEKRLADE